MALIIFFESSVRSFWLTVFGVDDGFAFCCFADSVFFAVVVVVAVVVFVFFCSVGVGSAFFTGVGMSSGGGSTTSSGAVMHSFGAASSNAEMDFRETTFDIYKWGIRFILFYLFILKILIFVTNVQKGKRFAMQARNQKAKEKKYRKSKGKKQGEKEKEGKKPFSEVAPKP